MKICLDCRQCFDLQGWSCPYCNHRPVVSGNYLTFSPELAIHNDGYSAEYFAQLIQLEASNFWFKSRNKLLIWALRAYFQSAENCLEIGCGTGFVLMGIQEAFPYLKLFGSEIFTEGLTHAQQRLLGVTLLQMDARSIPFQAEFDLIGAFDVLEHIEEDELVLSQMFQATKPGGGIILTVPQHRFLWSYVDEQAFHKRRYARKELLTKVQRAGFTVERHTSFVALLLPLMMLSRLKRQLLKDEFNPVEEYNVSPRLNQWLENILSIERFAISRRLSFPVGGSLLVVARKAC